MERESPNGNHEETKYSEQPEISTDSMKNAPEKPKPAFSVKDLSLSNPERHTAPKQNIRNLCSFY
jgi:hypothetical protein